MKIIEIRHKTISIPSKIQNAYIDFSQMTVSAVAIITDVIQQGKQVIGYGFSSIGRYGQEGVLSERIIENLKAELRTYLDMGYKEVKIKVGQLPLEEDLKRIEAAIELVGNGSALAVDANGIFSLEKALGFSKAISPYLLKWYEEPGDPLDYKLHAEVARVSTTPIATGENLFSLQDNLNMILYGGLNPKRDILQMDPVLGYGLTEYLRISKMLSDHKWSLRQCIPHGGNLFALHIVAGLGLGGSESYPAVFQPFGGIGDNTRVENGIVKIPDIQGIGIEQKSNLYRVFLELVKN